jgi:hypothetical protein
MGALVRMALPSAYSGGLDMERKEKHVEGAYPSPLFFGALILNIFTPDGPPGKIDMSPFRMIW